MYLTILLNTPNFTVSHDESEHLLYVTWRGQYDAVAAVTGCMLVLRHVQQTGATKVLNDSAMVLDGWNEVARWVGEDFFVQLANNGVKAIAWVKAEDWPAQTAINTAMNYVSEPLVDIFDDTVAACRWLHNFT